jgi:hypothetical protein
MRVRERPHHATRLVRHVEICTNLEAVERLEEEAERRKQEKRPPSHSKVALHVNRIIA